MDGSAWLQSTHPTALRIMKEGPVAWVLHKELRSIGSGCMSEAFDPFREWLGREGGPPRDYYELLGIARGQTDVEAIGMQADVLTAQIRRIRPGPHVVAWQELLDAVAAAKRCLTDPKARAAYDAGLAQGALLAGTPTALPARGLPLEGPTVIAAADMDAEGEGEMPQFSERPAHAEFADAIFPPVTSYRRSAASTAPATWWVLRGLAGLVVLLAATLGVLVWEGAESPRGSAGQAESLSPRGAVSHLSTELAGLPAAGPAALAAAAVSDPSKPGNGFSSTKLPTPAAASNPPAGNAGDVPADLQKLRAVRAALSQARGAMARRDLASARKYLQAASQQAQTPEDEAQVARVEALLANLEEFWKGMQQVLASLQPAQEFTIGATPIIVVSADSRSLTYRTEGANRTVTLQEMPGPLVLALAEAGFRNAPSQKVLIAAFLAADAQGDPRRARRLLEEAAGAGEDVEALLAEVKARGAAGPADKLAPPDPARLSAARQQIRERFQAEFRSATRATAKTALAQKILDAAEDASLAAEVRYAMLAEACELATAAGKAGTVCQAVDQLDRAFQVDAVGLKLAALERMAKAVVGLNSQKEFIEAALKTASQAMDAQRVEEARRLADGALAVARRSRSPALLRAAQSGRQQLGLAGHE